MRVRVDRPVLIATAVVLLVGFGAIGTGLYVIVIRLTAEDYAANATIPEFAARTAAKTEYSSIDSTAAPAFCGARRYRHTEDIWEIECVLSREDGTEVTLWEVSPDGEAELIETALDPG